MEDRKIHLPYFVKPEQIVLQPIQKTRFEGKTPAAKDFITTITQSCRITYIKKSWETTYRWKNEFGCSVTFVVGHRLRAAKSCRSLRNKLRKEFGVKKIVFKIKKHHSNI